MLYDIWSDIIRATANNKANACPQHNDMINIPKNVVIKYALPE